MNNKININPSSTKWLEKDDRVVADYFCDLGFRSLKQKLSKLYGVSVDCLIGNDEVVDTSITEKEAAMISAMRQADERARQDAIALLELHTGNKKI